MPKNHLLCEFCDGTGFHGKGICPCCQGLPRITFCHFSEARGRVEELTDALKKLHAESNAMRRKLRQARKSPKVVEIRELDRMFRIEPPEAA